MDEIGLHAAPQATYRLAESVRARRFEGEVVLLDLERELSYSLNETGSEMLMALLAGESAAELAGRLAGNYAVERSIVERDVERLVSHLVEQRILVSM